MFLVSRNARGTSRTPYATPMVHSYDTFLPSSSWIVTRAYVAGLPLISDQSPSGAVTAAVLDADRSLGVLGKLVDRRVFVDGVGRYRCLLDAEDDHGVGLFRARVFGYGLQWEKSLSFMWLVGSA